MMAERADGGEMLINDCQRCKIYSWRTAHLIAYIQAFINHHRYPEMFNLPELTEAEAEWQRANDFNVGLYQRPLCSTLAGQEKDAIFERAKKRTVTVNPWTYRGG